MYDLEWPLSEIQGYWYSKFCKIDEVAQYSNWHDVDWLEAFITDRNYGRAYATVLRPSSSSVCLCVCDVMYCG